LNIETAEGNTHAKIVGPLIDAEVRSGSLASLLPLY